MTDLPALLSRVEGASGPDDALNVAIWAALWERYPVAEEIAIRKVLPNFTGSIDAALALVERKLPGWGRQTKRYAECGEYEASLWTPHEVGGATYVGVHKTSEALALLAALIRALIAETPAHD